MQAYVPQSQSGDSGMTMVVRSTVSPAAMTTAVRQAVASVEKGQLVFGEETMDSLISESLSQRRFTLGLLGAFAGLALLLAVIGVYGVMAYSVESRRREFGIRLALGAKGSDVIWLVLNWSLRIIGIGLGIGIIASIAASRMLTSLLFEVQPTDQITLVAGALLLVITGVIASYLPARRAAKVDPMMALRSE
jgi:putative ABC transport system permease protein